MIPSHVKHSMQSRIHFSNVKNSRHIPGKFPDLMRIYLNHTRKKLVCFPRNWKRYLFIWNLEKLRFQDNLEYEIVWAPQLNPENYQIPSLIVQPFVENAIKHGLFHKLGPRKLWVRFSLSGDKGSNHDRILICEVEDNGIGRKASGERKIPGQKNHASHATTCTRSRLELLNLDRQEDIGLLYLDLQDDEGRPSGTKVVLKIPIN